MYLNICNTAVILISSALTVLGQTCDPLTATCPPNPGLANSSYSIDFTQYTSLPPAWTIAAYENVTFSSQGAGFTFAQTPDAPYMWTSFYIFFGHVDVVLQAAPGTGVLSSAILLSDDGDEIDWEFSGNNFGFGTNATQGHVQTNYLGKGITGNYDRGTQPTSPAPQLATHNYSFDWSESQIVWSVDGTVLRTLQASDCDNGTHQYPQTPMQLHLGLWDAGDSYVDNATATWAGGRTDKSQAPFTMYVKSVSITNSNPAALYTYGDQSGSWQSIKMNGTNNSSISSAIQRPSTASSNPAASVVAGTTANSAATFTLFNQGNPSSYSSASSMISAAGYGGSSGGSTAASYVSSGNPSTTTSTSFIPGSTITVSSSSPPSPPSSPSPSPTTITTITTSYYSTTTIITTPGQPNTSPTSPIPPSVSVTTSTASPASSGGSSVIAAGYSSTTPAPLTTPSAIALTTITYGSSSQMSYPVCCADHAQTLNCVTWTSTSGSTVWTTISGTSPTQPSGSATLTSSQTMTMTVLPLLPFCNPTAGLSTNCYRLVTTVSTPTSGSASGSVCTTTTPSIVPGSGSSGATTAALTSIVPITPSPSSSSSSASLAPSGSTTTSSHSINPTAPTAAAIYPIGWTPGWTPPPPPTTPIYTAPSWTLTPGAASSASPSGSGSGSTGASAAPALITSTITYTTTCSENAYTAWVQVTSSTFVVTATPSQSGSVYFFPDYGYMTEYGDRVAESVSTSMSKVAVKSSSSSAAKKTSTSSAPKESTSTSVTATKPSVLYPMVESNDAFNLRKRTDASTHSMTTSRATTKKGKEGSHTRHSKAHEHGREREHGHAGKGKKKHHDKETKKGGFLGRFGGGRFVAG